MNYKRVDAQSIGTSTSTCQPWFKKGEVSAPGEAKTEIGGEEGGDVGKGERLVSNLPTPITTAHPSKTKWNRSLKDSFRVEAVATGIAFTALALIVWQKQTRMSRGNEKQNWERRRECEMVKCTEELEICFQQDCCGLELCIRALVLPINVYVLPYGPTVSEERQHRNPTRSRELVVGDSISGGRHDSRSVACQTGLRDRHEKAAFSNVCRERFWENNFRMKPFTLGPCS